MDLQEQIESDIHRVGWSAVHVFPTLGQPIVPFTYTIGLYGRGWPEMIVFGMRPEISHAVLGEAIQMIKNRGYPFVNREEVYDLLLRYPCRMVALDPVAASRHHTVQACQFYGRTVPVTQLVWPDSNGRFPSDPACDRASASIQAQLPLRPDA